MSNNSARRPPCREECYESLTPIHVHTLPVTQVQKVGKNSPVTRMTSIQNILIIKLRYIGDVILCTPLVRALRTTYPKANISFLVNPGTEGVLHHHPDLQDVLILPRENVFNQLGFLWNLRARKFDAVLDLTDGDRSAFITATTGALKRIGFNNENRWRGIFYTHRVEARYGNMHMIDYHGQAGVPLGIQGDLGFPSIYIGEEEEKRALQILRENQLQEQPYAIIHPTARYWSKAWPADRFAALIDRFAKQGLATLLVGSEKDQNVGREIQEISNSHPISIMGKTSILELAALMKRSVLFVGNDGGPMHMAAAMGCPVLGIFGPTDPAVWGPRGKMVKVIYKGFDCDACFLPGCLRGEESCLKIITVDEVYTLALQMLSQISVSIK